MKKSLTNLLSGALVLGLSCGVSAAPIGQPRLAPEASRSNSELLRSTTGSDRDIDAATAVRKVATATSPFMRETGKTTCKSTDKIGGVKTTPINRVSASLNAYGTVIYNNTWTSYDDLGVYKLPVSTGGAFTSLFGTPNPVYGFYDGENRYYSMYEVKYGDYVMGFDLYIYDTETGENVNVIEYDDIPLKATDVAYDTTSGRVYGCFSGDYYGDIYRFWGYLDLNKKNTVSITNMDFSLRAVAIDKLGQAYGIDLAGALYKIDKETGTFEKIGDTNCPTLQYLSSAAYNDKDGSIILAYCNDGGSGLVEINPATAASTVISEFANEEEVIGMYIPAQAPDKAPATPQFSVSCADGSLAADFKIVMPATLYDGTDATGAEMGYKVYANAAEVASGKAIAGAEVNISATLTESGMYNFIAVATNESGESNQAKASCYVGKGTPAAATGVKLEYTDGSFTLSWEPVTVSSDGGFIEPAQVRYDIVDAEGATVTSDLTDCTWSITQAIPDDIKGYSFGVVAKYDAKSSTPVMSNVVYLGHYNAPLSIDLKDQAAFSQHIVIDANGDGKTWKYSSSKGTVYSYSSSNDADDWLISPAIYLEAGKAYDFEAIAHAYSDKYPEKIEIKMGMTPDVEGMTTVLSEPVTLGGANQPVNGAIAPAESGEYYIGFHAVTEAGQWDLTLVSYSISEPYGATAPDAVNDLKVTPDINGELSATITFTTASTTVTGDAYTGDMKLSVLRDGELIKELTAAAGTAQTVTDNVEEAGRYTYSVEAYNMDGEQGRGVAASSFVGPNVPNPPTAVKAVETADKCGELNLSWEHATTDIDGNPLNAANLSYNVYIYDNEADDWKQLNEEPVKALNYTFTAQEPTSPQAFVQVGVQTINRGVVGDYLEGAGLIPVGPAYELPMAMSTIEDVKKYIVGIDPWDGCEFGMKADGDMNSVTSQDGDAQFFYGERTGSSTELGMGKGRGDFIFGKVSLKGAVHPVFTLYTWKITETDVTKLDLIVVCDGEKTVVSTIDYEGDTHNQWTKKVINLEAFAGKTIQPIIRYHSSGLVYCFFDNMKIVDMPDYDLGAVSVTAPKTVTADEEFDINVLVENVGRLDAGEFTVELTGNGNLLDTKTVDALAANEKATVTFKQSINMAGDKEVVYSARVIYGADADLSNNVTSKTATVKRQESILPAVANLSGVTNSDGNLITWDAITDSDIPYDAFTESFENAEAFSKEYPGWTFIDRDDRPTGNLGNIDVPNHEGGVDHESFIVFDGTHDNFASTSWAKEYLAADGKQYLGSIYSLGESAKEIVPSDDWAVSPLLKGCAQTVSFKGKNCSINYSELIQVWYTTLDSTNPDDFTQIEDFNNPGMSCRVVRTDGWGDFSFELPEGAKRFAIRVVSNDGMMFMLDQVEYLAADATKGLELTGYNIYCDGTKLNAEPLTANSYTHSDAEPGKEYIYHVTALYNRGESEAGSVSVLTTGIGNISAAVRVAVEGHSIVVTGAADSNISIIAADGKTIYSAEGDASVGVTTGVYLVKVGSKTTKVIVR